MKRRPLLSRVAVALIAFTLTSGVARAEVFAPPAFWAGKAADEPARSGHWSIEHAWPNDKERSADAYKPLVWRGERFIATEGVHSDSPSAVIDAHGQVLIRTRGSWGGNPGRKTAALIFTAPASGVYRLQAELAFKRSGGNTAHVALLAFADRPSDDKKPGMAVRQIANVNFRLSNAPRPTPIDREVFLKQNDRIALQPGVPDNVSGELAIRNLKLTHTPAEQAPAGFIDGLVKPAAPPPPAEEAPPKIVVEGDQIVFPADANVRDVTKPPYNAKGDGRTDDTAAIQAALNSTGIVYLPNGVYLISSQLRFNNGKIPKRLTLQGQSTQGTIIKLRDNSMDFSSPKEPQAMLWTSHFPPQAFRNYVRHLTFDTGKGNPGAIGVQFYASNVGSIEDVTIRSGDGAGVVGLDLGYEDDQGPMLARNIRVEGFDVGVSTARQTTVTTCENIHVQGQRVVGWRNNLHAIAVRKFTSVNSVPAMESIEPGGHVALIEATLTGTGEASKVNAINNVGGMFLRDVKTTGYANAVVSKIGKDQPRTDTVAGPNIEEWTSHPVLTLFEDTPKKSLRLAIKETPKMPWGDLKDWVSVKSFKPEQVPTGKLNRGKPEMREDWGKAFQAALDSGKATVYFPDDEYTLPGRFVIPANVKRLMGLESSFQREGEPTILEVGDGTDPLFIERWDWMYSQVRIEHKGNRPVVMLNQSGGNYRPQAGAGEVFINDNSAGSMVFARGQKVWLRQTNPEYGHKPHILNDGADLWILGIKTEGYSNIISTRNGGRTEVIGGSIYANQGQDPEPAFINDSGTAISVSVSEWVLRSYRTNEWFVETRGDETRVLKESAVPKRGYDPDAKPLGGYGTAGMVPLFVGGTAREK